MSNERQAQREPSTDTDLRRAAESGKNRLALRQPRAIGCSARKEPRAPLGEQEAGVDHPGVRWPRGETVRHLIKVIDQMQLYRCIQETLPDVAHD